MKVSSQPHAPSALPLGKEPRTQCVGKTPVGSTERLELIRVIKYVDLG